MMTDAVMKKGLVPEGLIAEPQIVALGCEATVIPIRLDHDLVPVAFDAEMPRFSGRALKPWMNEWYRLRALRCNR